VKILAQAHSKGLFFMPNSGSAGVFTSAFCAN
jgi:hypothetical protein